MWGLGRQLLGSFVLYQFKKGNFFLSVRTREAIKPISCVQCGSCSGFVCNTICWFCYKALYSKSLLDQHFVNCHTWLTLGLWEELVVNKLPINKATYQSPPLHLLLLRAHFKSHSTLFPYSRVLTKNCNSPAFLTMALLMIKELQFLASWGRKDWHCRIHSCLVSQGGLASGMGGELFYYCQYSFGMNTINNAFILITFDGNFGNMFQMDRVGICERISPSMAQVHNWQHTGGRPVHLCFIAGWSICWNLQCSRQEPWSKMEDLWQSIGNRQSMLHWMMRRLGI